MIVNIASFSMSLSAHTGLPRDRWTNYIESAKLTFDWKYTRNKKLVWENA